LHEHEIKKLNKQQVLN